MGLFNWANMRPMKEGKGVDPRKESALSVFFGVLQRKLGRFFSLNVIYLLAGLPKFLFMGCIGLTLLYFHSGRAAESNMFLPAMLILIPFTAILSGPATMGAMYVLRNFAREQHAWVVGDLFEKASKNYVQGLIIGLINSILAFLLVFAYLYYGYFSTGVLKMTPMNYIILLLGVIFSSLRSYIYPMAVSYKLSIKNLYRYSLALVIMKFPQNLLLQLFSLGCIYAVFYYPNIGLIISAVGGIAILDFVNIFYTDRVLLQNMDESNEKVYPKKESKK